MAASGSGIVLLCMIGVLAAAGSLGEEVCLPMSAVRGEPLELSCLEVAGCHRTHPSWVNVTDGLNEEIQSGIDAGTGKLTVSDSVVPEVGGQMYQCSCGAGSSKCYVIHIPPLVSISLTSQDVPVGGEVGVTCTAVEGYPLPTEISLFHPGGVAVVQNGQVYPLKNLSIKDSGELQCVLSDVSGQLRAAAQLNVFNRPQVVTVSNATIVLDQQRGGTATISCSILRNNCRTVVMFFKDGSPIRQDTGRFIQQDHTPSDSLELKTFLIISGVVPEDFGRYECMVYANYSTLLPVASQELFLLSSTPPPPPLIPETDGSSPMQCSSCGSGSVVLAVVLGLVIVLLGLSWTFFIGCYLWKKHGRTRPMPVTP